MSLAKLEAWPRRKIRYVMFRIQARTHRKRRDFQPELKALVPAVRAVYQDQPGFGGWHDFARTWDIGIDDVFTMRERAEKWWCFGISRFTCVAAQHLAVIRTDSVVRMVGPEGIGEYFFHQGFARAVETIRGGPSYEIDYGALVASAEGRTAWPRS